MQEPQPGPPERVGPEIPLSEIVLRSSRSSGPGGQHANVTASRVEAVFEVAASAALNEEQKRLVTERLGSRVVAVAQDARSQARNRDLALQRLRERVATALHVDAPRTPTGPTRSAVRRRLESKRLNAARKRGRQAPRDPEGDGQ